MERKETFNELTYKSIEQNNQGRIVLFLDGEWELKHINPEAGKMHDPAFAENTGSDWYTVNVPATVQKAFFDIGEVSDPYIGRNSENIRWMEKKEWWYKRKFQVPSELKGRKLQLVFEGIDHKGDFWLNGQYLGRHTGMFGGPVYDITDRIRYDSDNELYVHLVPPPVFLSEAEQQMKPTFNYGWAYIRLVSVGIWKSVRLEATDFIRLESPFIYTKEIKQGNAIIALEGAVACDGLADSGASIRIEASISGHTFQGEEIHISHERMLTGTKTPFNFSTEIPGARLWWTHDLGKPDLYRLDLRLYNTGGRLLDSWQTLFGIRQFEIKDENKFYLNGVKLFAKGINWITCDAMLDLSYERYSHFLTMAAEANINFIRVWGGGIIETRTFYDLCDKMGILVMQDYPFMVFAFNDYFKQGFDPDLNLELVRKQSEYFVKELRNHASLALWTGGNELLSYLKRDKEGFIKLKKVQEICSSLDHTRPVWECSPSIYGEIHWYDHLEQNAYNWDFLYNILAGEIGNTWLNYSSLEGHPYHPENTALITEYGGFVSPPVMRSLKKFIPKEELDRWPPQQSDTLLWADDKGDGHYYPRWGYFEKMRSYRDLVKFAQLYRGIKIKWMTDLLRSESRFSGGFVWSLCDPSPTCFTAVVDWYGTPKKEYYYVKNAYEPVHVGVVHERITWQPGETFRTNIFIVNDTGKAIPDCTIEILVLNSRLETTYAKNISFNSVQTGLQSLEQLIFEVPDRHIKPFFVLLTLKNRRNNILSRTVELMNFEYYESSENLSYPRGEITVSGTLSKPQADGSQKLELTVTNTGMVAIQELAIDIAKPDNGDILLDDNYFWMMPGEVKTLKGILSSYYREQVRPAEYIISLSGWNVDKVISTKSFQME